MAIEIDHISLSVEDFARAKEFYATALKPLRIVVLMEFPKEVTGDHDVAGLGADGKAFLWIASGGRATPHTHIALRAESRAQVDAFHAAAIAAGGTDNGPPGLRPHYHKDYYGAFILDPEGHNIEAVTHVPDAPAPRRAARSRAAAKATGKTAAKPAGKTARAGRAARSAAPERAPAKRTPAKPGPAKRAPAKRAPAKRAPAKRAPVKRAATRPAAAKKPAGRKTRR